jgi:hypothetical protein
VYLHTQLPDERREDGGRGLLRQWLHIRIRPYSVYKARLRRSVSSRAVRRYG